MTMSFWRIRISLSTKYLHWLGKVVYRTARVWQLFIWQEIEYPPT
jgi:hypothetical protein